MNSTVYLYSIPLDFGKPGGFNVEYGEIPRENGWPPAAAGPYHRLLSPDGPWTPEHSMTNSPNIDLDLATELNAVLNTLLAKGFTPPFHWALISSNGCILSGAFHDATGAGLQMQVIGVHAPQAIFAVPLNLLIVDTAGQAAHVAIQESGQVDYLH
jgi:hypothetical protein